MKLPSNYLLGILTGVSVLTSAQAADNLSRIFENPPPAAHPHTWWHWNSGNVNKKGITPLSPTLRSDPMALSGASRRKQIPSSRAILEEHWPRVRAALRAGVASRYFKGGLDDSALFRGAMSATDIGSLAKQSVATFSCLSASANVALSASSASAWEDWRAANFNFTELADPLISGPNADKDHDGIVNLLEHPTPPIPAFPMRSRLPPITTARTWSLPPPAPKPPSSMDRMTPSSGTIPWKPFSGAPTV